jgi:outer membrane protein insertion porin family
METQMMDRFTKLSNAYGLRSCLIVFAALNSFTSITYAQGSPDNIQSALPAFNEPSFKDRLYANGGPMIVDSKNGKRVAKVTIEGNQSISEHNILSRMETREERIFDMDVFSRDLAELHRTGYFQFVRPVISETEDCVELRLVVSERATIREVTFHGNQVYSDKKLLKYCGFQVGDPISPQTVLAARNRMEEFYRSEGFNQASVEAFEGSKPGDRKIVYRISEGELERVDNIEFVGNVAFSSELLQTKIQTKDSDFFIPKISRYFRNKAILDKIEDDEIILTEYYRSLGYFDARIRHTRKYDASGKWVTLVFVISEGEPYNVRNVSIEGNQYYATEKIQPFLEVLPNTEYRQVKKINDERFLRDAYGTVGFIFADVVARLELEPETHMVDIVYEIDEGDIYRCSDVNIHINGDKSYTKENVARNLMSDIRPGDIYDSVAITNAKRRLGSTQVFETNPANGEPPRLVIKPFDEEALEAEVGGDF